MILAPPWILRVIEPGRVSIWRCGSCRAIYRRPRRDRCEACGGQVLQWKRCSHCLRWKPVSGYYLKRGRWPDSWCRRCHSIHNAARSSARYHADPVFADRVRRARRDRHARQKAETAAGLGGA